MCFAVSMAGTVYILNTAPRDMVEFEVATVHV